MESEQELSLEAAADEGAVFVEWTGDCAGSETTSQLTLDESKNCTASFESAAPQEWEWVGTFGSNGSHLFHDVALTDGDDAIVVGDSLVYGAGGEEAIVARIDSDGVVIWQNSLGSAGDDELRAVAPTGDGDFIAVGTTEYEGLPAIWVVRFTSDGDLVWEKGYQTDEVHGGFPNAYAMSLEALTDGNFLVGICAASEQADFSVSNADVDDPESLGETMDVTMVTMVEVNLDSAWSTTNMSVLMSCEP